MIKLMEQLQFVPIAQTPLEIWPMESSIKQTQTLQIRWSVRAHPRTSFQQGLNKDWGSKLWTMVFTFEAVNILYNHHWKWLFDQPLYPLTVPLDHVQVLSELATKTEKAQAKSTWIHFRVSSHQACVLSISRSPLKYHNQRVLTVSWKQWMMPAWELETAQMMHLQARHTRTPMHGPHIDPRPTWWRWCISVCV